MKYTLTNDNFEVVGKQYLQGVGGYDGTNPNTNNDVATVLPNMVEITYSELVSLRNSSKLIPGQQYRITDYITTTSQEDTLSAGHQFDIIVTADDVNVLNENARACKSVFKEDAPQDAVLIDYDDVSELYYINTTIYNGKEYATYTGYWGNGEIEILIDFTTLSNSNKKTNDYLYGYYPNFYRFKSENSVTWGNWTECYNETIAFKTNLTYFADSDLNAWELKYCLDNDTTRFEWAQISELSPETKRKIIRVYDGRNNDDISYIFLRWPEGDENGEYAWLYDYGGDDLTIKEYVTEGFEDYDSDEYIYTTTENPSVGYSIDGYGSVIEVGSTAEEGKGVIYYMKDEWNNECPYDFKNILFDVQSGQTTYNSYTFYYKYGNRDESLDGSAYNNVIKPYKLGDCMYINKIRFGNGCSNNSFGYNCYNNSFGNSCYNNSFGNYCYSNSFGNDCDNNSFGNSCYNNSFGNSCYNNSFGNSCYNNTFGGYCNYNSFGNSCSYIAFGASSLSTKNYYKNIIIDNGCGFINLNCTSTTSNKKYYQNVRIGLGVTGAYGSIKTISSSEIGQTYETLYLPQNSKTTNI